MQGYPRSSFQKASWIFLQGQASPSQPIHRKAWSSYYGDEVKVKGKQSKLSNKAQESRKPRGNPMHILTCQQVAGSQGETAASRKWPPWDLETNMHMAQAHCCMDESPLFEGGKVECIKSTHFSPSNFKCSLHTYKASSNSFSVRCQQSIILSVIKIKMPLSALEIKK